MRRWLLVLALGAASALVPVSASAALLWTMVASPLTAVAYQTTTFTFTATNLDALGVLGCLQVDLPSSFLIQGTGTPMASNSGTWLTSVSGNAVLVHSIDNPGRLKQRDTLTFTVQARPTVAGAFSLANHSHVSFDCLGTDQPGVALPMTVLPGPTPTPVPTPKPTPVPTPRPTATPTPLPIPTLPLPTLPVAALPPPTDPVPSTLPTPLSHPDPTVTPRPLAGSPSPSGPSPRASASAAASASVGPRAGGGPSIGGSSDGGSAGTPAVRLEPQELKLNMQLFDLLGSPQVWFVPAAAIGAPGLLVLLWVALQSVGTLAWIPSVRRMRGEEERGSARSRRAVGR